MNRLLVIDDDPAWRALYRLAFEGQFEIFESTDAQEALAVLGAVNPDVILLDLRMPGADGVTALRGLRDNPARVLVVTSYTEPSAVLPAVRAGAAGYVYKDVDPPALAAAIRSVHAGHVLLHPDVARLLADGDAHPGPAELTARERGVLAEVARGRSNREIAKALSLSEKTVKTHVSAILGKLGVQDRTQAALHAVRTGLVDL